MHGMGLAPLELGASSSLIAGGCESSTLLEHVDESQVQSSFAPFRQEVAYQDHIVRGKFVYSWWVRGRVGVGSGSGSGSGKRRVCFTRPLVVIVICWLVHVGKSKGCGSSSLARGCSRDFIPACQVSRLRRLRYSCVSVLPRWVGGLIT